MNNRLSIQVQPSASLSGNLPEEFTKDWLPGSTVIHASGSYGDISTQSISIKGTTMYYIVASITDDVKLQLRGSASFFFIQVHLRGAYEIISESLSYKFGSQNRYSFLFLTDPVVKIKLVKQAEYKSVIISYPLSFVWALLRYYPFLDELDEKIKEGQPVCSLDNNMSGVLAERIYGLLHTPFAPLMEEYFQSSFKEILQIIFNDYMPAKTAVVPFNLHDVSCIRVVKEYIDTHLLEHLTIAQLSRKAGINQLKLKKGFKAIYGIGVYGYRLQQRMLLAKTALEKTTKPIHQVARQTGYRNVANFSAAFKKIYGISPYQHRLTIRKH